MRSGGSLPSNHVVVAPLRRAGSRLFRIFRPASPVFALPSKTPRSCDLLLAAVYERGQPPACLNCLHRLLPMTLPPLTDESLIENCVP